KLYLFPKIYPSLLAVHTKVFNMYIQAGQISVLPGGLLRRGRGLFAGGGGGLLFAVAGGFFGRRRAVPAARRKVGLPQIGAALPGALAALFPPPVVHGFVVAAEQDGRDGPALPHFGAGVLGVLQ